MVRIAAGVAVIEGVVPDRVGVVAAEPAAPVVAIAPVLCLAGQRLEAAFCGEIAAAETEDLAGFGGGDFPAAVAVGEVEPTVGAPL